MRPSEACASTTSSLPSSTKSPRRRTPRSPPEPVVLERIWNGWRASYVASVGPPPEQGEGSVFTRLLGSGLADAEANIVHRGPTCFAMLNAFPYGTGHTLVLPYR